MNITILPYIDKKPTETVPTASAPDPADSLTDATFQTTFQAAQTALTSCPDDTSRAVQKAQNARTVDAAIAQARRNGQKGLSIYSKTAQELQLSPPSGSNTTKKVTRSQKTTAGIQSSAKYTTGTNAVSGSLAKDYGDDLFCSDILNAYFDEAAKTYNVDVKLLKSIAKTESNFSPTALSGAGAMGIMQLMPYTAKELNVANAYDPYSNIMGGANLIAKLLDKYDNNVSLAVAAYNAGSGSVDKYGGIPPFDETQNYVRKVTGYYYGNG